MTPPTRTILLVESSHATVELYRRELSKDFRVLAFEDESGVLEAVRDVKLEAVIIEPELPSRKGWELLSAIQSLSRPGAIPVLVCSTRDDRRKGKEFGVDAYLIKPVLPGVLLEQLRELLARSSEKRSRQEETQSQG